MTEGSARRRALRPIAVVGAGSWGTALAIHLARQGRPTRLWARDRGLASEVATRGENARYLAGLALPPDIRVTADAREALAGARIVVVAVPSHGFAAVVAGLCGAIPGDAAIVSATKGLEPETRRRMSEVLAELLPGREVAVLSGPSFAREVALGQPAALVVAAADPAVGHRVQQALASPSFRLYTNSDVVGVELGGALKNVVAIATGISDSLGLGENARAALITRGLAEIARLGVALGARPETFAGLAGLGDLVLTCAGSLSRNRALGLAVGAGRSVAEAEGTTPMVAEGVRTVLSAVTLGRAAGVSLPISEEVAAILFLRKSARDALAAILARDLRPETEAAGLSR
ncbi:MAG: NAD(P)-dependent glycerol-3-phosphate dehydrogenase [Candidatus Rokubacteria bacterium]|nr:NAD(P)-dependent glycerol-3-phosphate dehydrogenase [Candidatus Rokubacteria bacterium]